MAQPLKLADMTRLVLIIHNVRSAHNVGSMLRTAEGLGIDKVYMTGYTPYPEAKDDERLPHLSRRMTVQIHKTALGAEESVPWERIEDIGSAVKELRGNGFIIAALEQAEAAIALPTFNGEGNLALIVGNEVEGLDEAALKLTDIRLVIPMAGQKESFNVAAAAAMALYHLKHMH